MNLLPAAVSVFLSSTARRVRSNGEPVVIPSVEINGAAVDLRVLPSSPGPLGKDEGLLVFFEGVKAIVAAPEGPMELSVESAARIQELKDELVVTRENLRTAVEDLEATNEELQATNEELIASNEELQSTNEELQSVNEELFTVNTEYQEKIEELEHLTGDLENLLRSIDVGALFLDADLRVRRYNDTVLRLLPLRAQDLGRSLSDLVLQADYPSLYTDVADVSESRQPKSARFQGRDGTAWGVQIRPFEEDHRLPGGVIVMFNDRTTWREQETLLGDLAANELAAGLAGVGMVLVDVPNRTTRPSDVARRLLGLDPGEVLGYGVMQELFAGEPLDGASLGENTLPTDSLRSHRRPDGSTVMLRIFAQRLVHQASGDEQLLVALQEVRL